MGETDDKEKDKAAGTSPLQWIKDLQDKQEEAANEHADAINAAGDAYQQGYAQRSAELKESLDSANETARQAGITYADLVQTWIDAAQNEANAQRKRNEAQDQRDNRVRMWGGIAEAASALVNLIGTTKGAASQKWESPQQKWAERADKLRREREKKLEDYRNQMKTLQQQKAQLVYSLGKDEAEREEKTATIMTGRDDQAAQQDYKSAVDAAQVKAQGTQQGIALGMQGANMLLNSENAAEGRRIQRESLEQRKKENEFTQRSYGFDPETNKWWNPKTKAYDLDAPSGVRGTSQPKNGVGGLTMDDFTGIRDELAVQMGFKNYNEYRIASRDNSRQGKRDFIARTKDKPELNELLKKLVDPTSLDDEDIMRLRVSKVFNEAMGYGEPANNSDASPAGVGIDKEFGF